MAETLVEMAKRLCSVRENCDGCPIYDISRASFCVVDKLGALTAEKQIQALQDWAAANPPEVKSEAKESNTMKNTFKKSDLKTGMRVKLRDGGVYLVLKDYDTSVYGHQDILFASYERGFMQGDSYDEDSLKFIEGENGDEYWDIVEVYSQPDDSSILSTECGELLWRKGDGKTYKDVLLERFPDAKLCDDGTPVPCKLILFQHASCHDGSHKECWDEPYKGD